MATHDNLQAKHDTVRVAVVAIEGCLTVAVAGLVDVFAVANKWEKARTGRSERRFEIRVLSAEPNGVRSFTGYPMPADGPLDSWAGGDIVICSAVANDPVRSVQRNPELVAWLAAQARVPDQQLASVCTGAFFLAEAGLLDGHRATTNPLFGDAFAKRYPAVKLELSRVVVDEGGVVTAGTVSAGLNLALHLVERHSGVEVAAITAKALAVDKNRETQVPYLIPTLRLDAGDELAVRTQRLIEARHSEPDLSLETLAAALSVAPRTLQRRFHSATGDSPITYLRLVRLEAAKRLLETTDGSIDSITWDVGYRDSRSFSRLFRANTTLTPSGYRARFGTR